MGSNQPYFKFYTGDYRKDADISRASKSEKGMLTDLFCVMWGCESKGIFATAGTPWSDEEIATAAGGDRAENLPLLAGLCSKGILRRNKGGALFSPFIVRLDEALKLAEKNGKKGGNPALKGGVKEWVKGRDKLTGSCSYSEAEEKKKKNLFGSPPAQNNNDDKENSGYYLFFTTKFLERQGLSYQLTDAEKESLKSIRLELPLEKILACWEMWWMSGESWSKWAEQRGHAVGDFCGPTGIRAILEFSERVERKAKAIQERMAGQTQRPAIAVQAI